MARINIPPGTWTNQEIELVAGKLVMLGYSVRKGSIKTGEYKGVRFLDYETGMEKKQDVVPNL